MKHLVDRKGRTWVAALALLCLTVTAHRAWATPEATTSRLSEPVILEGSSLGSLGGTPVSRLAVWAYSATAGWRELPSQVDQRDDADQFVAVEGSDVLDRNDELVFMADGLGEERPEGSDPPIAAGGPMVGVRVTDPLQPDFLGVAYVAEGHDPSPGPQPSPSVVFDPATHEIRAAQYTLGFADPATDGFIGLRRLSLRGDAHNRIDRTKIRVSVPQIGDFNEESLAALGGGLVGAFQPVVEGPVRLVMSPDGSSMAYGGRARLIGLDLGAQIPLIPGLEFRISLDLSPDASGAIYSAADVPSGVPVDGAPDKVPVLSVPMWRQVAFPEGRLVMLLESQPTPLLLRTYYKDDASPDAADTGDGMSFGDSGLSASSFDALASVGFLGQMVIAPTDGPSGAELARQLAQPLHVEVENVGPLTLYLPALRR